MTEVEPLSTPKPNTTAHLVGRAAELTSLRGWMDEAGHSGARVVIITGEPGIGKSRLVGEALTFAHERGWLGLTAACFPGDLVCPYAPVIELLREQVAARGAAAMEARARPFASDLHTLVPDLIAKPHGEPAASPLSEESQRRRLFDAFAACLAPGDPGDPLLLAVDDLHWADATSLDLLHYIVRTRARSPLLVLAAARANEISPALHEWIVALRREVRLTELALPRLSHDQVVELVAGLLATDAGTARRVAASVNEIAEGIPFYVEELLRSQPAREAGLGTARPTLPGSLADTVRGRIEGLSTEARTVVRVAAVAGRRFDFDQLQVVTSAEETSLVRLVRELVGAGLVVEETPDTFAFRHALVRETIYQDLLSRERRSLHRLIAQAIEALSETDLDRRLNDLAVHYAEAGDAARAFKLGREAGDRASALHAPSVAVEHYSRAIAAHALLLKPAGEDAKLLPRSTAGALLAVHAARGRAYETLGLLDAARQDYEQSLELARTLDESDAEVRAQLQLGAFWAAQDYERGGAYLKSALQLARRGADAHLLSECLNRLGNWHANTSSPSDALVLHDEALRLCRAGSDRQGEAVTLDLLGAAHYLAADLTQAMNCTRGAARIFRELGDRQGLVGSLSMLAYGGGGYELCTLDITPNDVSRAENDGRTALGETRAMQWRSGETFALIQLADALAYQGQYEQALALRERAQSIAEEDGHGQWQIAAHVLLGRINLDMLGGDAAAAAFERARTGAQKVHSAYWSATAQAGLALAHLRRGDPAAADAAIGAVSAEVNSLGAWWLAFAQGRVLQARDAHQQALEWLGALESAGGHAPLLGLAISQSLLELRELDAAECRLHELLEASSRRGAGPHVWRCHESIGRLRRLQGDAQGAERAFSAARATLDDLARTIRDPILRERFLQATTQILPRGYRVSHRRAASVDRGGLTVRELEIARLVAAGRTNREIADILIIGERTVESHVSHVLNKLGGDSRRDISRWVEERETSGMIRSQAATTTAMEAPDRVGQGLSPY